MTDKPNGNGGQQGKKIRFRKGRGYTVVGIFPDAELAQNAAAQITTFLHDISDWYTQPENAEAYEALLRGEPLSFSEPEMTLAEPFKSSWSQRPIDWLLHRGDRRRWIVVADKAVYITPTRESKLSGKPFAKFIDHLGGKGCLDGWLTDAGDPDLVLNAVELYFNCRMVNEGAAETLCAIMQTYFDEMFERQSTKPDPPWKAHYLEGEYSTCRGRVRQEGVQVYLEELEFSQLSFGVMGLVPFLNEQGCTEFGMDLTQVKCYPI